MHASRNSLTCKPIRYPYKKQRKTPFFLEILFEILTHTMLPSKLLIMISAPTFLAFPKISTFARIVFDILTRARPENLPKNVKFFGTEGGERDSLPRVLRAGETGLHCKVLLPGVQSRRPSGKPAQRRRTCPQQ